VRLTLQGSWDHQTEPEVVLPVDINRSWSQDPGINLQITTKQICLAKNFEILIGLPGKGDLARRQDSVLDSLIHGRQDLNQGSRSRSFLIRPSFQRDNADHYHAHRKAAPNCFAHLHGVQFSYVFHYLLDDLVSEGMLLMQDI